MPNVDDIAEGLLDGTIETNCPYTQQLIEDVKEGRVPIEKLKEEIAKARLKSIS